MSDKTKPPKPAYTVEISVGGCEWERVAAELLRAAEHVVEHGPDCRSVWGGAGTHGHVHITRRDVTPEQYNAELSAWFESTKSAKAECFDDCPPGHCACHDGEARTVNRTHTADAAGEGDA